VTRSEGGYNKESCLFGFLAVYSPVPQIGSEMLMMWLKSEQFERKFFKRVGPLIALEGEKDNADRLA
jgi:hypothetical protein